MLNNWLIPWLFALGFGISSFLYWQEWNTTKKLKTLIYALICAVVGFFFSYVSIFISILNKR